MGTNLLLILIFLWALAYKGYNLYTAIKMKDTGKTKAELLFLLLIILLFVFLYMV